PDTGDRWTPNRLGTGYYSEDGLASVDARSAIGEIKQLKMRVRRGASSNSIEGTDRNGSSLITLRDGATQAEEAHVMMAAGFANPMHDDPAAADAARRAAVESGADQPQGFLESMAANWMAYTGGTFKQTALAKGRFKQAMYAQAVKGSEAYV